MKRVFGEGQRGQAEITALPEDAREMLIDKMVEWVGGWFRSRAEEVLEEPWSYGDDLEAVRWQICGAVAEDLEDDYGEAIEELICEAYKEAGPAKKAGGSGEPD